MDASTPPLVPPSHQDRRTGLIVLGVFALLIGAACALFVPLIFFGQMMTARRLGTDFDASSSIIGAAVYGLMAVTLIWLGVGSILCRRWARALLLCLGWIGLIIGLVAMPAVYLAMSSIGDTLRAQGRPVPTGALFFVQLVAMATTFVIYIVIPGIAVLFYRSPHVKHTCEVRDPVERWTDRCPLPVLALCVLKAWSAVMLVVILPIYGRVFPVFGSLVEGWSARLLWIAVIGFLAYTIRGFYRLDLRTWWFYAVGSMAMWTSSLVTIQRLGLIEFYRHLGLPERQLALMARNPLLQGNLLMWISLVGMVVWYVYLLGVRRYFTAPKDRPAAA